MTTLSMRAARGVAAAAAALVLGLTACSSPRGAASPSAPAGSPVEDSASAAPAAAGALDFTGTTLVGSTLDAATLAGTPVVLWFWAPF